MARQKIVINGAPWKTQWRKFSKEDARRAMAKFTQDRLQDETWVEALARMMDLGLWDTYSPAQTPIAFDRDGNRINGKHRLAAFLRSRLDEIVFPVITNCRPEDFARFDHDTKIRTRASAFPDIPFVTREQARINWLEKIVSGELNLKVADPVFRHLYLKTWRKQAEWSCDAMKKATENGRAPFVAPFMYAHKLDPEFADAVGRKWINGGDGLPPALKKMRDSAIRSSGRSMHAIKNDAMRASLRLLTALALMHQGKPVPERISDGLSGLRYFSSKLRDGAAGRWDKTLMPSEEA